MGLEQPQVSLLEHLWPHRVQRGAQPKAEQDSATPGGHQLALPGRSCRAPALSQLEELPELGALPVPHLQREIETLPWQLRMLDLLTEAEPSGRPTRLQRLQDQRYFPSIPGEELLAWPAEQSSVLIRHGCCRSSSQALGAGGTSCCRKSATSIRLLRASSITELFPGHGGYWEGIMGLRYSVSLSWRCAHGLGSSTHQLSFGGSLAFDFTSKPGLLMCALATFTHFRFLGQVRTLIPCCTQQLCMKIACG